MARIRYIKPAFFTDEEIGDLKPIERLAYAGLWCYADRSGRLEDRPRSLKVKILPYDNVDFDEILNVLTAKPFIIRYSANGSNYIQIVHFLKHQKPHNTEQQSVIPPPKDVETTVKQPLDNRESRTGMGIGMGMGNGNEKKNPPLKATAEFSEGFIKKADEAKTKGLNIYQLMNRFYKESKLTEKLPEAVFSAVLDEFNLRGEVVKDHWPYFIKVLENKSAVHFASRNIQEGEEFKKKPAFSIAQIMESMK